ncbi:MAG: hypothetical protein J6P33_05305 [Spirochaetales bacterium]|nr:hypothetical protein [Spirochaetales bacterium]
MESVYHSPSQVFSSKWRVLIGLIKLLGKRITSFLFPANLAHFAHLANLANLANLALLANLAKLCNLAKSKQNNA